MATPNPLPNREEELAHHLNETQPVSAATPAPENGPFVLPNRTGGTGGKDNTSKMLMIAGAIVVLLVVFFGFISTKGTNKKKATGDAAGKPNLGRVVTPSAPGQLVPADKMAVQSSTVKTGSLEANDIEKTKTAKAGQIGAPGTSSSTGSAPAAGSKTLGEVAPFQQPNTDSEYLKNWSPEQYPGAGRPSTGQEVQATQKEQEEFSKPSMIFVAHEKSGATKNDLQLHAQPDNFGLQSGYHVAARLESMASTALHAPVTAVIEYNYEREGRVLIPAGSRAVGKITQPGRFPANCGGCSRLRQEGFPDHDRGQAADQLLGRQRVGTEEVPHGNHHQRPHSTWRRWPRAREWQWCVVLVVARNQRQKRGRVFQLQQ